MSMIVLLLVASSVDAATVELPSLPVTGDGCELAWALVGRTPPDSVAVYLVTRCGGLWCEQQFVFTEGKLRGQQGRYLCSSAEIPEPDVPGVPAAGSSGGP